jgi:hypothetical protein
MRRAYKSEIWESNGEFVGINLGSDFVAEHEWGIKAIKESFNMSENEAILGIAKRMIFDVPKNLIYRDIAINKKKYYVLILIGYYNYEKLLQTPIENWLPGDLKPCDDSDLVCAWSERSFGILVSDKYKNQLEILYKAFQDKDIVIGIGGDNVFKNGGLKLAIASKLPKEIVDEVYNSDLDIFNLKMTVKETGIYDILKKAKKRYLSLFPKWKDESKKEVIFWLNPTHQHLYNYGWYTVQDLIEWADNKGKIIIQ